MLEIARILKSHGVDGGILIGLRDIEIEEINLKEPVYITFDGLPVPFFFTSLTPKGASKAIARLCDVESLEDAEELVGRMICLPDAREDDSEDESFVGWEVFDHGRGIGRISGLEPIPGNPCIYVGDKMIPLSEDFIVSADPAKKELRLELPEGLLDL